MIKKYMLLSLLLLVLLVLFAALKKPLSQSQDLPVWTTVESSKITRIAIQAASRDKLVLSQKDGQWYVQDSMLANQEAVLHLRDDLAEMQPVRVLTRGHKHDKELGFSDASIHVRCWNKQGNVLLDMVFGKQGSDLLSTYARRVGDNAIVAVDKVLLWQLKRTKKGWRHVDKVVQ